MKMVIRNRSESESGRLSEFRERQLMAEIVDGSELAFQALASELRPLIISMVRRTLGSGSEVDDVCQTVLLSIWKGGCEVGAGQGARLHLGGVDRAQPGHRSRAESFASRGDARAPEHRSCRACSGKICPHPPTTNYCARRRAVRHGRALRELAPGTAPSSGARLSRRSHADRGGEAGQGSLLGRRSLASVAACWSSVATCPRRLVA